MLVATKKPSTMIFILVKTQKLPLLPDVESITVGQMTQFMMEYIDFILERMQG